jgi:type VI secretion system secreted protein VgrG
VENNDFGHIKGNEHATVDGEKREQTGKDHSFNVTGTLHLKAGNAWLTDSGTELHIKAGQKTVIEAGAEITLKAGGSFVKIDRSGVAMGGAAIKLNAGGSAGNGSGQAVQIPDRPGLVDKHGGVVAPAELADVGQRPLAERVDRNALLAAAAQRAPATRICQKKQDGSCNVDNCPCVA